MVDNKALADNIRKVNVELIQALSSQEEINKIPLELYIASFYSSITQYADAICSLIENNKLIAIPPIFRTLLEAYVEFLNLCKYKENYTDVLLSMSLWNKINKFEATFKEPENPFLKDTIENYEDIGAEIRNLKMIKGRIDKNIEDFNGDIKQIKTRFELAGIKDAYTGIYSQLCEDSHNGLLRIEDRHLKKEGDEVSLTIQTNWTINNIAAHAITTIDILKSVLINAANHLNFSNVDNSIKEIEKIEGYVESNI